MPTKTTTSGREYDIDGKRFTWHPLDDDDQPGNRPDIVLPLRIKLGVIRKVAGRDLDVAAMFDILGALIPDQGDVLDDMDIATDFQPMFVTWQDEYNALTGATPGESSSSPT